MAAVSGAPWDVLFQDRLPELERRVDAAQTAAKEAKTRVEECETRVADLVADVEAAHAVARQHEETLELIREQAAPEVVESVQSRLEDQKAAITRLEADHFDATEELARGRETLAQATVDAAQLQDQLAQVAMDKAKMKAAAEWVARASNGCVQATAANMEGVMALFEASQAARQPQEDAAEAVEPPLPTADDPMPSFPASCSVFLESVGMPGQFLGCRSDPYAAREAPRFVLRGHASDWETFHMVKLGGGRLALQDAGDLVLAGGYGGPLTAAPAPSAGATHCIQLRGAPADDGRCAMVGTLDWVEEGRTRAVLADQPAAGEACISWRPTDLPLPAGEAVPRWRVWLAPTPVLPARHLRLRDEAFWCRATPATLSPPLRVFLMQLLRAMGEVGSFFLVGHGIPGALYDTLRLAVSRLPRLPAAEAADEAACKRNWRIQAQTGAERSAEGPEAAVLEAVARAGVESEAGLRRLAAECFLASEQVANGLLHALALAQMTAQGCGIGDEPAAAAAAAGGVAYRPAAGLEGPWRDEHRLVGLRCLAYPPGPAEAPLLTARHTDATWLTLLRMDGTGGLEFTSAAGQCATPWFRRHPPSGAVLVNAGNVLQTASGGFYRAVCHWVARSSQGRIQTRVSMPFFYDRLPTGSFHGGGTGGC